MRLPLIAFLIAACASPAGAQTLWPVRVNASVQALVSWQPVRRDIGGPPYVDHGLGGLGPGLAVGADFTVGRLVFDVEHSRTRIRVTQTGRRAGGRSTGALDDPLITVLGGIRLSSAPNETLAVAVGFSIVTAQPEQNGVPIPYWDGVPGTTRPVGLATGFRYNRNGTGRLGWTITGRYSHLPRSDNAAQLGVSAHVIRVGVGVRVRLR